MGFETVEGLITINATLPLQILHFIILMFVLDRLLFKPTLRLIDERQMFIDEKRKEMEKIRQEAEGLKKQFVKMEEEAKRRAAYERTELRQQGIEEAEKLLRESQKEVAVMKQEAEKRIEGEMEKVKPQLSEQAKLVAKEIMEKIVNAKVASYVIILLFLMPVYAFAAEAPSRARLIYNNIMLFVNFGIIVFLFIKYAKKPLLDFLYKEQNKVKKSISKLEEEYDNAKLILKEQQEKLDNIQTYIEDIRKNVLEIAQREKQKIIEEAKRKAEKLLEEAKLYYDFESARAKQRLKEEMITLAITEVKQRWKKGISNEANEKIIAQFIKDIEKSARN